MTHYKLPNGTALCGSEMAEDFVTRPHPSACNKCMRIIMVNARSAQVAPIDRAMRSAYVYQGQVNAK